MFWKKYCHIKRAAWLSLSGLLLLYCCLGPANLGSAAPVKAGGTEAMSVSQTYFERKLLFNQMSALTGIAWYHLAAVDQYERTLTLAKPKTRPKKNGLISIYYTPADWSGPLNPRQNDLLPKSISFFGGIGRDGSGDGKADPDNDLDVLYTTARNLLQYGYTPERFGNSLWQMYHNSRSVERIAQFSKIYKTFGTLDLNRHAFVLPLGSDYTYRSTWGASRSWGGYRIHEGTDLFAHYGLPVKSACYGMIEIMGWNRYGGWRIGIRDTQNVYHYYAHLSGFNKELKQGSIVEPGKVIGWVGNSGYGKPGTQGKFPPHLHYGLYRDNGYNEWSFDPYPSLRRWEREERSSRKR